LERSRSKLVFLKIPGLQESVAVMKMTALDLKVWTYVNVCLVAVDHSSVRSSLRWLDARWKPGTAPSGMGIDNENDQVS
jgi:hypothetical protein